MLDGFRANPSRRVGPQTGGTHFTFTDISTITSSARPACRQISTASNMEHSDFAFSPYSWPPTSTTLLPLESMSPLSQGFDCSPLSMGLSDEELQTVITNLDLAQSTTNNSTFTNHTGAVPIPSQSLASGFPPTWQPIPRSDSTSRRQAKRNRAASDYSYRHAARTLSDTSEESNQDDRPRCYEHGCNGRTFSNVDNYKRHLREQRSQTTILCPFCGKEFSRKSNMDTHVAKNRCKVVNNWLSEPQWNSA